MHLAQVLSMLGRASVALAVGLAVPVQAASASDSDKTLAALNKIPPMEFFVARGAPDACGPGCDSWIAAEGRIVADTPARLRAVLDKRGKRNLPIFFASPGGKGYEGLAIGRILRQRKMTAGVGRTVLANCLPAKSIGDCSKLLREKPDAEAALWTRAVSCNSSCAYAILGAVKRDISPTALVGVHAARFDFSASARSVSQRQRNQAMKAHTDRFRREFLRYFAEMKIDGALLDLASQTQFEHIHFLTRQEMYDLGIDRRVSLETGWHFGYQAIPAVGIAAFANIKAKADGPNAAKHIVLIVSCNTRQRGNFILTALQRIPNASTRPAEDLRVSVGEMGITLTSANSFLTSHKNDVFEVRQQGAARGMVERLLGAPEVAVAVWAPAASPGRRAPGETPQAQYSIPGAGAAETLKTLVTYCSPAR